MVYWQAHILFSVRSLFLPTLRSSRSHLFLNNVQHHGNQQRRDVASRMQVLRLNTRGCAAGQCRPLCPSC
jgi:hypothetical protein